VIQLKDKYFETFITAEEIQQEISAQAKQINQDYADKHVVFVAILNGAFMFASDLIKNIDISCEITFVKVSSYHGTASTGRVDEIIGLTTKLRDKHVIILEDIVDTGITMDKIHKIIELEKPASLKICTLLYKPSAHQGVHKPDYVGFSIPNAFVVGFGLDYDELGRNLKEIYQVRESKKKENSMLNIVLFGPPGAGKGTQSERIIDKYGLVHLSTGDIFRANIKGETELGMLAKSFMDLGKLVPDSVTIDMLKSEVRKHENPKGFIFDGFPRTNAQAEALDAFLAEEGSSITLMLALDVPEEELRERLKKRAEVSGRVDDANPEVIQKRIDVYIAETMPVKSFYQAQNKFINVNGLGSVDEITARLFQAIDSI
jgi:adenylate kinase